MHTKGDGWISSGYRVDVDIADGLSGICEMSDWMDKKEMNANAQLIAAAPDLLVACKQIVNEYEKYYDECSNFLTRSNLDALKQAINKAEKGG